MKLHLSIFIYLLISVSNFLSAQNLTPIDVPIIVNGKTLNAAFVGGLSAPQFSQIDLDNDGKKDLFIFDRNGNVKMTYLNKGGIGEINYEYAPQYESFFPNIHTWCLLKDFNSDGVEDIFKAPDVLGIAGIEVWRGSRKNNQLTFEKIKNPEFAVDVLTYKFNNIVSNIYASIIDLTGIEDVDNDGDMDILSFEPDGSFLQLYLNKAIEQGMGRDTFIMTFEENCFGKFVENQFSETIVLSNNGQDCASFIKGNSRPGDRHSGSTVTASDIDCDGDVDIFLGDIGAEYLTFLKNGGTAKSSWMTEQDARWPVTNEPVRVRIFPAAYVFDVNNDGKKDVIVASNESGNGQNRNNVWLYLNEGEACKPEYKLTTKNFLVDDMLITSVGSHPAFYDYNGDGLLDIIVGTNGVGEAGQTRQNRMFLFTNIGTKNSPAFELTNEDFLQLSAFPNTLSRLAPCLGDLDGDGDADLFVGNSQGGILYFQNEGLDQGKTNFRLITTDFQNIFVGPNSSPVIYDFDGDGLLDFIIGESNNSLNFYKNKGSKNAPFFDDLSNELPNTDNLGKLFSNNNFATQNGSPEVFVSSGQMYLLMGNNSDSLSLFVAQSADPTIPFVLLKRNILPKSIGKRLNAAVADLNNDGKLDFMIGNERGGLTYFGSDIVIGDPITSVSSPTNQSEYKIYPNPAAAEIMVAGIKENSQYLISNSAGQILQKGQFYNEVERLDIQQLRPGVYFLQMLTSNQHTTMRFSKL
ncbi:MAG TPA: T9SS type A sorting domain-containing protein [Saprospiraceae bacterium]|nr:T9SS type A sorting domain-containing protein [Saprospiraceae bacterium]